MTKTCTKCKEAKELNKFHRCKRSSDGRLSWCALCMNAKNKRWRQHNPEKEVSRHLVWRKNNPDKEREIQSRKQRKRWNTDPVYRSTMNLRRRMRLALRGANKSASSFELLGCTGEELKKHLESQFVDGMTWDNYGLHGWHIDHIRPCSEFDLSDHSQQRECFHHKNLRPLWAEDNLNRRFK